MKISSVFNMISTGMLQNSTMHHWSFNFTLNKQNEERMKKKTDREIYSGSIWLEYNNCALARLCLKTYLCFLWQSWTL